jgi:hypothetical protein
MLQSDNSGVSLLCAGTAFATPADLQCAEMALYLLPAKLLSLLIAPISSLHGSQRS